MLCENVEKINRLIVGFKWPVILKIRKFMRSTN